MDTLTPMLVEPSSGSYISTYLPPRRSSRTCRGIGCSSSSDATTHTRPVCSTAWRTVSLANKSSFCCTSPWTLIVPDSPRISVKPARRTWREMIFAARQMSYRRFDSSPVASGWSRSCSMMYRSIVTTDVGDCERAMTRDGEGDRAPLIGTEHGDAMSSQPRERLRRGMTVTILRAHADDGFEDRKSTRLNSSHLVISYAVFCLKKKKKKKLYFYKKKKNNKNQKRLKY